MKPNAPFVRVLQAALCLIAAAMLLCRCDEGSGRGARGRGARVLRLTSGYTEIVVSSLKVPGYWAEQTSDGQVFFLSTPAGTYERGDAVEAKGPYGLAMAAVFDDETRVYQKYRAIHILVVREMSRAGPQDGAGPADERTRCR